MKQNITYHCCHWRNRSDCMRLRTAENIISWNPLYSSPPSGWSNFHPPCIRYWIHFAQPKCGAPRQIFEPSSGPRSFLRIIVRPPKKSHILRKFQQTPGTYPRYPNIQIWKNFLHTHLFEGLGYVPGVCSSFLRCMSWAIIMYTVTISPCITHWLNRPKERWFPSNRATHSGRAGQK